MPRASGKDIRQLFERQGALVSRVLRISVGTLKLDKGLSRGQHRQLTSEEVSALLKPRRLPRATNATAALALRSKRCPVTPLLAGPNKARYGAVSDSGVGSDSA